MNRFLVAVLVLLVLPAQAEPDPRMREYFAAEVEPSGLWRQDNAEFDGQPGSVHYWSSRNAWGPGGHSVLARVDAIHGDGRCEPVAQLVHFVDPADGQVHSMSLTAGGIVFRSTVERNEAGELIRVARGVAPDGTEIVFRDRSGYDSDVIRWSQGETPEGEGWKALDRATWQRVTEAPHCP